MIGSFLNFHQNTLELQGSRRFFKISTVEGYNSARRLGFTGLANSIMARYSRARNRMFSTRGLTTLRSAVGRRQRRGRQSYYALKRKTRGKSGIGVTGQHDVRRVYTKRSMPIGKKKRWRRFAGKVHAVAEKDWGTQQGVFNINVVSSNTNSSNQNTQSFYLYSLKGTASYASDLYNLSDWIDNGANTANTGLIVDRSSKVIFQSGVLDLTIRNASTYNNGTILQPVSEARMEVDVYEVLVRKKSEDNGVAITTLESMLYLGTSDIQPVGGALNKIDINKRGCTPFDLSYPLSRYGIKILSKTKYQISNNDQITYQIRDPKRRVINLREMSNATGFNLPGWTRCVLVIGKLAPGLTVGPGTSQYQEVLQFGITRKYSYKIENYSEDRSVYATI